MNNIITVSRQYGSGGRIIAQKVAEQLGIPFYDKEIIDKTAQTLGYDPEFIKEREQKLKTSSFLGFFSDAHLYSAGSITPIPILESQIFVLESEVINSLADKGDCVIVGRCADYVLEGKHNCLNVFVHADIDYRKKLIMDNYNVEEDSDKKLEKLIFKTDKARARHYYFFTDRDWGKCSNYNLTIDSSRFGLDKSAEIIQDAFRIIKT